jgi:hypothetical protein
LTILIRILKSPLTRKIALALLVMVLEHVAQREGDS